MHEERREAPRSIPLATCSDSDDTLDSASALVFNSPPYTGMDYTSLAHIRPRHSRLTFDIKHSGNIISRAENPKKTKLYITKHKFPFSFSWLDGYVACSTPESPF